MNSELVFVGKRACSAVQRRLEHPKGHWFQTLLVSSIVVCTGPKQKRGRFDNCSQSISHGQESEEKTGLACLSHHVVIGLCGKVSCAQLTLIC